MLREVHSLEARCGKFADSSSGKGMGSQYQRRTHVAVQLPSSLEQYLFKIENQEPRSPIKIVDHLPANCVVAFGV